MALSAAELAFSELSLSQKEDSTRYATLDDGTSIDLYQVPESAFYAPTTDTAEGEDEVTGEEQL